jgi:hypothetical protein
MSDLSVYYCPNCQIGLCQPGKTTYLRLHEGLLVSVPDMPMWTCDICQYQEFDPDMITRLETLLGSQESASEAQRNTLKVPPKDAPEVTTARRIKP